MAKRAEAEIVAVNWDFLEEGGPKVKETKSGRPGMTEAMRAMCFRCMGGFLDGREDCTDRKCPLYTWSPYREREADLSWRVDGLHIAANRKKLKYEMTMSQVKEEKRRKNSKKK